MSWLHRLVTSCNVLICMNITLQESNISPSLSCLLSKREVKRFVVSLLCASTSYVFDVLVISFLPWLHTITHKMHNNHCCSSVFFFFLFTCVVGSGSSTVSESSQAALQETQRPESHTLHFGGWFHGISVSWLRSGRQIGLVHHIRSR